MSGVEDSEFIGFTPPPQDSGAVPVGTGLAEGLIPAEEVPVARIVEVHSENLSSESRSFDQQSAVDMMEQVGASNSEDQPVFEFPTPGLRSFDSRPARGFYTATEADGLLMHELYAAMNFDESLLRQRKAETPLPNFKCLTVPIMDPEVKTYEQLLRQKNSAVYINMHYEKICRKGQQFLLNTLGPVFYLNNLYQSEQLTPETALDAALRVGEFAINGIKELTVLRRHNYLSGLKLDSTEADHTCKTDFPPLDLNSKVNQVFGSTMADDLMKHSAGTLKTANSLIQLHTKKGTMAGTSGWQRGNFHQGNIQQNS